MTSEQGRRDRNKQDKRDRIFRAAADLFAELGYEAVTTRQISERADVAAGTLFRYAASKSELLLMVYNERFATSLTEGQARAALTDEVVGAILAVLDPILDGAGVRPEDAAAYQRELIFGSPSQRYRDEGLALVTRTEDVLAELLLREASRRGVQASADAAHLAARSLFAIVHLDVAGRRANTSTNSVDDIRRQVRQIVDGFALDSSHEGKES